MKILWFSNNPCYAINKIAPHTQSGGWLKALNYHIAEKGDIELHVCFYWPTQLDPFEFHKTKYYPVTPIKPVNLKEKIAQSVSGDTKDEETVKKLMEIVELVNPNLIHVHGTELNLGLIQYHTEIPVVISIQGLMNPYYEKYFSGIPEKYLRRTKKTSFTSRFKAMNSAFRLNAIREQKILKVTNYIIGRTNWDKRITGVLAPNRQYFVGNEILRKSFYDKENFWSKTKFNEPLTLVTTTGNVAYKGFELIVKSAELFKEYGLDIEWRVIGLDKNSAVVQAVKQWLNSDFDSLGLKFCGMLNETELIENLLDADIYCQVSRIENSPNSLCEAMMLGMPIVATNVGGTSSMLKDNVEGILTQEGEPYDFTGAVLELQADFEKAKTYGQNSRTRALERHDPEKVVDEITTAYRTILNKNT